MSMKSYTRGIHMANNQQAWVHNDVCPMEGITFFLRARPHRSCWHSFDLLEVIDHHGGAAAFLADPGTAILAGAELIVAAGAEAEKVKVLDRMLAEKMSNLGQAVNQVMAGSLATLAKDHIVNMLMITEEEDQLSIHPDAPPEA